MADNKITGLTELTSAADADLIPIVDDPSGTATTKKITKANLLGSTLENVVEDTTPQLGGDLDLNSKNITAAGPTTISSTEVSYLDGVTSAIQTQLDAKGTLDNVVEDTTPQLGGDLDMNSNNITAAGPTTISPTEMSYLDGVTSNIQTQLDAKGVGDALTTNPLSQFAATTSAQLAGVISNETGSGALVFATSPTLVTPVLGTPSSGNLGSCTAYPGDSSLTTVGTVTSGNVDAVVSAASDSTAGKVELATAAETTTGTDATRAVTPDGLAGSEYGERAVQIVAVDYTTDTAVGDGAAYFHIDSRLGGMNLVDVHAEVITAGTTGTTDIQIYNVTQTADMLSTKITIDSTETGSDTAATPAVIDAANDDVAENDLIRIDVDAVSTTAAKGLIITLGFRLP